MQRFKKKSDESNVNLFQSIGRIYNELIFYQKCCKWNGEILNIFCFQHLKRKEVR